MNEKTKRGLAVLEAALLLGILGDALLRATPWGLNVSLWTGALALAVLALLARGRSHALAGEGGWLALPLIFFSASFAWRDSLTLQILDGLALLITFSLIALRARGGRIQLAGMIEYVTGGVLAVFNALFGAFPLVFSDIHWKEMPRAGWMRHAASIARGLAIAVPVVLIFGALLMAADAVFEGLINKTLQIDFNTILSHILLLLFLTWMAGGFLRSALLGRAVPRKADGRLDISKLAQDFTGGPPQTQAKIVVTNEQSVPVPAPAEFKVSLGIVEIGVVLGLLNLLFLTFVIVQVRYFFGGAGLVQVSAGLTYAEYARRGFFELVWVTALILPLLLSAHWLLSKENPAHERVFRLLAGMQVALLFVIMTSAIGRMRLYQREYGLTELRLYTTAFMGWLALVFVWFAATVLRGRRERFACGALVTGFLMIAALHVMNPDAYIVRVNVSHAQAGRSFDAEYATSLSADAAPALFEALPSLNRSDRCLIATRLLYRSKPFTNGDWRTWNSSRSEAANLPRAALEALWQSACVNGGSEANGQANNAERR